ncbi:MAG: methyltransferase domain-containing protein [Erysipelotrichaceae bacterium]|nr:methyltransferase domain-containing protein [Erysipelotrichaceae bacterium]
MNILCPVCKKILNGSDKIYSCKNRHSFDIAKEGYLNLNLKNSQNTGDNTEMIRARKAFLEKGYYDFLRQEINKYINENDGLVDLACGEGYYTSFFKAKDKIGIDLSKTGLRIASKADKTTTYLLCSIFHDPLQDKSADVILTIFAPIAKEEIVRILKDDGIFILVKPDKGHLYELKEKIYEHPYYNEVEDINIDGLTLCKEIPISRKTLVKKEDLNNLFMMTPYYNTTSINDKEKLKDLNDLSISFSFLIDIYRKEVV